MNMIIMIAMIIIVIFIFLNSGIIPEDGGIHDLTACAVAFAGPCASVYPIKVKHCGLFNVYYLVPTAGQTESYCIGK